MDAFQRRVQTELEHQDTVASWRSCPEDSAGQPELWRFYIARDERLGKPEAVIIENLEQEAQLARFKLKRVPSDVAVRVATGEDDPSRRNELCERRTRGIEEQITNIENEIATRVKTIMYPGVDRLPSQDLGLDFAFAVAWELFEEWGKLTFADAGFLEEPEILVKALDKIGLRGLAGIVQVARRGGEATKLEMEYAARQFAAVTAEEERQAVGGCYNRLRARRGARGQLVTIIDQVGDSTYVAPYVESPQRSHFRIVRGARQRSSRGRPIRRRGSRRLVASSSGSDDPGGGEPEPATRRHRRLTDVVTREVAA